jgi:hypothetical protein
MRRTLWAVLIGVLLGGTLAAQGDLSEQVLRLLTRDNTWSGVNTYANTVGVALESGSLLPSPCTNRLANLGGNLYFNCVLVATSAGAGTVTSVGLTMPAVFSVASSPITSSGTIAVTLATQTANLVWAGPPSAGPTAPTFRALVDADIPNDITISCTGCVTWASVRKSGSSLADLATRSASDLSSGTLPDGRFPATLPAASGVNLTALNATNLGSGTVAAARMPAMTGDATSTVGTVALTLANSGVAAATYGDATHVAQVTVDVKGRVTAASAVAITTSGITIPNLVQGDTLYASGTNTLAVLTKSGTATRYLSNTGTTNNPAWAQINLANGVTGTLPVANGGTALTSAPSNGQLLIGNGTNYTLATLTGTASQILVTNGSGSITLALPQSIDTTSTPQFARIGLGTGAGAAAVITTTKQFDMGFFSDGSCGASDTIDWNAGEIHTSTLSVATCIYTFSNPIAGRTYTLQVVQDGTGGRLVTWPGSVKWPSAAAPTLSTGMNAIDICTFFYNGTNYLGACTNLNY